MPTARVGRSAPGAVVFVPDGWQGIWDIRETVRKTYVIVRTAADS